MLAGAGLRKDAADAARAASEGWPAGMYPDRRRGPITHRGAESGRAGRCPGSERIVVDYLRSQMWQHLEDTTLEFLTRTSILSELTGSLCDAVLSRQGCGSVLSGLRGGNLLLVPLDSRDDRFRYHRLMRDALRSELERRESDLIPVLHDRASRWFERNGDIDSAVRHARLGGDLARTAELVWAYLPLVVAPGSQGRLGRWLDGIAPRDVARSGRLVAVSGWLALLDGDVAGVDRWLLLAQQDSVGGDVADDVRQRDVQQRDVVHQPDVLQRVASDRDVLRWDSPAPR